MKKYLKYLKYVFRHKWYVGLEMIKEGHIKRGLLHDISKFRYSELVPYANYFYGHKIAKGRDNTGYYKPTDTGDKDFDFAWLLHQKRNRHHWQWWILPEDNGGVKILDMPDIYIREMLCDWLGAGKAQYATTSVSQWYDRNKDKMQLSWNTQARLNKFLKEPKFNIQRGDGREIK